MNVHPKYGFPASGSPLHAAVISVESLDRSTAFYRDLLGFDVLDSGRLAGAAFTTHWSLPSGVTARAALLADRSCTVGRLLLIEFETSGREPIRNVPGQCFFGLVNLNVYVDDIHRLTRELQSAGCEPWSEPVIHDMGAIGTPVEVMIDAPDTLIINLIELHVKDPSSRINLTTSWIADHGGYNRCGATAVATSQHCVRDYAGAMAFNTRVLGMSVRNDTVLKGEAMEHFMRYPPGAQTRDTYLQGNHVFGKIAVNHPLNFACVDVAARGRAPHVGYLAQCFVVADLAAALAAAADLGCHPFTPPVSLVLPGLGRVEAALLQNPGSGALHEVIQVTA